MQNHRLAILAIVVLGVAAVVAAQNLRDLAIQKYDLDRLTPENRDAVASHIAFAVRASSAIDNADFEIYTLARMTTKGAGNIYIWSHSRGREIVTEHFIGAGAYTMNEGQSYLGKAGPLWLVLYKNGSEIKFTIK